MIVLEDVQNEPRCQNFGRRCVARRLFQRWCLCIDVSFVCLVYTVKERITVAIGSVLDWKGWCVV